MKFRPELLGAFICLAAAGINPIGFFIGWASGTAWAAWVTRGWKKRYECDET